MTTNEKARLIGSIGNEFGTAAERRGKEILENWDETLQPLSPLAVRHKIRQELQKAQGKQLSPKKVLAQQCLGDRDF